MVEKKNVKVQEGGVPVKKPQPEIEKPTKQGGTRDISSVDARTQMLGEFKSSYRGYGKIKENIEMVRQLVEGGKRRSGEVKDLKIQIEQKKQELEQLRKLEGIENIMEDRKVESENQKKLRNQMEELKSQY